jgi:16S rRNA processing protein RimM
VQFLTLARLVRTHGVWGELAAELETDDTGLFVAGGEVELWNGRDSRRKARLLGARPHGDRLIVRFEGIDSLTEAERVAGWEVQIPAERRPALAAGRYYVADLLGCEVTELDSGRVLGRVEGWIETGAVPVLEVRDGEREILIPFAAAICVEIDPGNRSIRVRLPGGLV